MIRAEIRQWKNITRFRSSAADEITKSTGSGNDIRLRKDSVQNECGGMEVSEVSW